MRRVYLEDVAEQVGPDLALEVGVDEVAAVEGAADCRGGEVEGGGGVLVGEVEEFLGGERTG